MLYKAAILKEVSVKPRCQITDFHSKTKMISLFVLIVGRTGTCLKLGCSTHSFSTSAVKFVHPYHALRIN